MKRIGMVIVIVNVLTLSLSVGLLAPQAVAQSQPLMGLPVALPPGPSTWLMGQAYGNTTGAFNNAQRWYSAGQGLHFGIDLSMPCGTPLVAMADGTVMFVSDLTFGSAPHNLVIRHDAYGVTVLYGHLLQRPDLTPGQTVQRGEMVALSGDPDLTCTSRPHLHLEVRSLNYRTAYNPIDYIDAPWHLLTTIGSFGFPLFQQDLFNTRRWMTIYDQPAVAFGGAQLNAYSAALPPRGGERPLPDAPLSRPTLPMPAVGEVWQIRQLGFAGCCPNAVWHPTNADRLDVIDGTVGQMAQILAWHPVNGPIEWVGEAPPPPRSPDWSHELFPAGAAVTIRRVGDGAAWTVATEGALPSINADNTRLMWRVGVTTAPGEAPAQTEIRVSDIDGGNARVVASERGLSARWLDANRLLISTPTPGQRITTLSVLDVTSGATFALGTWENMRGLDVAPGGGRLMFYITYQDDSALDGVYTMLTQPGAIATRLPWFGSWRWRDAESVYYIPFDLSAAYQTLMVYHVPTGQTQQLTTTPFLVASGDWSVSADGRRVSFWNADDLTLWIIEAGAD